MMCLLCNYFTFYFILIFYYYYLFYLFIYLFICLSTSFVIFVRWRSIKIVWQCK